MRQPVQQLIQLYQNNLFTAAFNICQNQMDAEDAVQETFVQYYTSRKEFENEQHIRAWLLRVVINKAKNINRTFWKKNKCSLEDYMETLSFPDSQSRDLFEEVMKLPDKYRIVIHLFYYEDYLVREIAEILKLSESNVKVRLSRGRALLKDSLKEESDHFCQLEFLESRVAGAVRNFQPQGFGQIVSCCWLITLFFEVPSTER